MWGILAKKIYDAYAIFRQFSDIKNGGWSQQPSPNTLELIVLRKANLIFQWISLSNATLLSMVFFACGVHKLNYIKNDLV